MHNNSCDAIFKQAEELENQKQWNDAAKLYVEALNRDDSKWLNEKIAWCLSRAGQYAEARKYLLILNEREPNMAKWPYMIGYQYYAEENWKDASSWFEKALEKKRDYFIVKYRLSYAYYKLSGNYNQLTKATYWKALGHLEDCQSLWSSFSDEAKKRNQSVYFSVCFLHGKLLMNLEKYREKAVQKFLEAHRINTKDKFCLYNLSKTYYLIGKYDEAEKYCPKGNQYYIIELKAHIAAKQEDYEYALELIRMLLKKRKKDYLYRFIAEVLLLQEKKEEALKEANKAISMNPKSHKNHFAVAKIYYSFGLMNKALEELTQATALKKEHFECDYQECVELEKQITSERKDNYVEDEDLLMQLLSKDEKRSTQGIISMFNQNKGFGFIKSDEGSIFFHISECSFQNVSIGDKVSFNIKITSKGKAASDIRRKF